VTGTPTEREDEGAWAKLRRRKVVQWGIAYAAGAWGFLQVLAYVSGLLRWPEQLQKLTGLALLIGLPIGLTLAWYHGDRGHQKPVRTELAIIALLLLLGGGALWLYDYRSTPAQTATDSATPAPAPAPTTPADARPSIAVLPFENRSAKQDDAFFVDGIHDDILTQLTKIGAMKVIARTSVEQFRDTKLTTKEIGDKLGVTRVLEGGVQRAGDRVRVTVQLIDTATDGHLWAENYDRELTAANIFAIQSEVATAIAAALKATLTAGEKARVAAIPTQNLEAWEAYQLGKQRMAKRTSESLAEAEKFFRKAIDLDREFALAWVGLADSLTLQVQYSGAPVAASRAGAEDAVAKALMLDPNLAEAWASSANIATDRGQFDRAEQGFHRAVELNPNYATAFHWFSRLQAFRGHNEDALALAETAAELDPLSAIINIWLGLRLEGVGRFDESESRLRRAIEIDPSMPEAYRALSLLRADASNRFDDAVALMARAAELDPGNPYYVTNLAALYLALGDDSHATALANSVRERWPSDTSNYFLSAILQLSRGNTMAVLEYAPKLLEVDPRDYFALMLLRDANLAGGHPELARALYATAYPELIAPNSPAVDSSNWPAAVDLALVLQMTGQTAKARVLLDRSEPIMLSTPRMGAAGYGISDVQIHALRGDKAKALAALREAEGAGWRGRFWRYYRDFDPNLASIRNEPEFKAVFADIERDMAHQRAELAKRPKDAPLDLGGPSK
jgi:TolB-like protein/Tfp pilus assembly protein PilF